MLGDIISPSIATWSAQRLYTELDSGERAAAASSAASADALDMNTALQTYTYTYNNATALLFDVNETSAYQVILNGTSDGNSNGIGSGNSFFATENGSFVGVFFGGGAANAADDAPERSYDVSGRDPVMALVKTIVMSVVLGLLIFITIIGNVFVIAAIILERNLQNVANYLVASLAVADLLVACLVMPLGAVYEISEGWILGPELCDIWTSCDVLCCTASILHLVAIAADRYWTVTDIDYSNVRTPGRVFFMIFCVWFTALIISLAPQFGWKDPEYMQRIEEQKCMVSQDVAYQVFATCCTFYVPLLVILALYWKIYKIARKRIQRRNQRPLSLAVNHNQCTATMQRKRKRMKICFGKAEVNAPKSNKETNVGNSLSISNMREETEYSTSNFDSKSHAGTEMTTASGEAEESQISAIAEISTVSQEVASTAHQQQAIAITLTTSHLSTAAFPSACSQVTPTAAAAHSNNKLLSSIPNPYHKLAKRRQLLEAKRERKAAQTLAIITGAFAVCWLPFFVMALLLSLYKECHINAVFASLFLWLGYFNSTLNPIIYTIFNPEFRRAFQRILCGRKRHTQRSIAGRSGKI